METLDKGMIHIKGRMEQDSMRFHHVLRTTCNLKFRNCLFLEFFINIFRPC